ncbi:NADPH-dependent FMN reductase [Pseudofrankia sp. BMG5.36]|nr:NADPH-dependent FMN reductase [Pseudofrankia sp. BMG5.36]
MRIGVILGSERPHRGGEQVATWVRDVASRRGDAEFELVAPHDYSPPPPDVPLSSLASHDRHDHATEWAARIASLDGFVIVASDRDHGISRMFEGALQRLYAEWNNKAVGFVSYGVVGGQAVERLRLIAGELMMADVRERLVLSPMADSGPSAVFEAGDEDLAALHTMLDQVVSWSAALAPLRSVAAA